MGVGVGRDLVGRVTVVCSMVVIAGWGAEEVGGSSTDKEVVFLENKTLLGIGHIVRISTRTTINWFTKSIG